MRGDLTILGGSGDNLIIGSSGADSINSGIDEDNIFVTELDLEWFDGSDTVMLAKGTVYYGLMMERRMIVFIYWILNQKRTSW